MDSCVMKDEFTAAFAKRRALRRFDVANGPLDTPCHVWKGGVAARCTASDGYGRICYEDVQYYAHRLAWIRAHSMEIPDEMWCLHLCDNSLCINPTHLYLGTPKDNSRDRDERTYKRTEPTMQSLYNCKRIDEDHYRVTKFDNGFVPFQDHEGRVSSYTCTLKDCECPQSHKPSCRHRKMLPFFIEEDHIDDNYFFCWDTHQWIKATGVFAEALNEIDDPLLSETNVEGSLFDPKTMEQLAKEGGHKPVSAAPSPQPSHYRRMR